MSTADHHHTHPSLDAGWRDTTSYSRGERSSANPPTPRTWSVTSPRGLSITITRKLHDSGAWYLEMHGTKLSTPHRIATGSAAHAATVAIKAARKLLESLLTELDTIEAWQSHHADPDTDTDTVQHAHPKP